MKFNRIINAWYKIMQNEKSYWNKWYIIVVLFLIVQIIIFYFITIYFK